MFATYACTVAVKSYWTIMGLRMAEWNGMTSIVLKARFFDLRNL